MTSQYTTTVLDLAMAKRCCGVLLLMSAAACGGSDPVPVAPAPTVHAVSGIVMEHTAQGLRPSAGATVCAWVQQEKVGFTLGRDVTTDAEGRYRLVDVPDGFIVLFAFKLGYDRPCAATVSLKADAAVDMQIVAPDSVSSPTTGASPTLSGTVFETTSEGRRPIAGARINWGGDMPVALTTSDAAGHYALCHLPTSDQLPFSEVFAVKTGFKLLDVVIPLHGDTSLDLEMKR